MSWAITRWYAPTLGRFLTEDSLLGSPDEPASRHLYAYGAGEPVGRWDPDGRITQLFRHVAYESTVGRLTPEGWRFSYTPLFKSFPWQARFDWMGEVSHLRAVPRWGARWRVHDQTIWWSSKNVAGGKVVFDATWWVRYADDSFVKLFSVYSKKDGGTCRVDCSMPDSFALRRGIRDATTSVRRGTPIGGVLSVYMSVQPDGFEEPLLPQIWEQRVVRFLYPTPPPRRSI